LGVDIPEAKNPEKRGVERFRQALKRDVGICQFICYFSELNSKKSQKQSFLACPRLQLFENLRFIAKKQAF
jgi:hypothetical protein